MPDACRMPIPAEAWLLVPAIAAIGMVAALLTMAASIRQGVAVATLEARVRHLRAQQRQALIDRGLIEDDTDESESVEVVDADPIADEPVSPGRAA